MTRSSWRVAWRTLAAAAGLLLAFVRLTGCDAKTVDGPGPPGLDVAGDGSHAAPGGRSLPTVLGRPVAPHTGGGDRNVIMGMIAAPVPTLPVDPHAPDTPPTPPAPDGSGPDSASD